MKHRKRIVPHVARAAAYPSAWFEQVLDATRLTLLAATYANRQCIEEDCAIIKNIFGGMQAMVARTMLQ